MEREGMAKLLEARGIEVSPYGIYYVEDNGDHYEVSIDAHVKVRKGGKLTELPTKWREWADENCIKASKVSSAQSSHVAMNKCADELEEMLSLYRDKPKGDGVE